MEAIQKIKSFRLGGHQERPEEPETIHIGGRQFSGRQVNGSGLQASRDLQLLPCPPAGTGQLEPEATVKKRILSAWNNVKYGKKAWNTVELFQQTKFSRNSPVWLLGQAYHRKLLLSSPEDDQDSPPEGSRVGTFSETDSGIEAFQKDYQSRLWFTYRQGFLPFPSTTLTTDCGWGCMIRSGQMMLAQALSLHCLGRAWREGTGSREEDILHRELIRMFGDHPDCPLSVHRLVELAGALGQAPGAWLGPSTVAHLLARAVEGQPGLLQQLAVYVAQDCTVYKQDVEGLCSTTCRNREDLLNEDSGASQDMETADFSVLDIPLSEGCEDFSLTQDVVIDGSSWCLEQESGTTYLPPVTPQVTWRALVVLVPVRLGSDLLNPIYGPCIKALLSHDSCIGIIGGRPRHSLYFLGFQEEDLIHLDPHRLQDMVNTTNQDFPLSSFHCPLARKLKMSRMDPSCCLGFYLPTRLHYEDWCSYIGPLVSPPHIAGVRRDYPMFVVSEGRGPQFSLEGGAGGEDLVSLSSNMSPGDEEGEEFVFL